VPIQIFQWTSRPELVFKNVAAAAIIVLLVVMLLMNATAIFIRNRFSQQY
jgi:phosphate transport system permease protein